MTETKDKKRSAPPADALTRLSTAVKKAPNHPVVRTWADVVRHGWRDFRELVLRKDHRPTDVAALLGEEFQRDFDEDYLRRLLLAEASVRTDKRMLKALGRTLDAAVNKQVASSSPACTPSSSPTKKKSFGHKVKSPRQGADLATTGNSHTANGSGGAPQSQIIERLRRNSG